MPFGALYFCGYLSTIYFFLELNQVPLFGLKISQTSGLKISYFQCNVIIFKLNALFNIQSSIHKIEPNLRVSKKLGLLEIILSSTQL